MKTVYKYPLDIRDEQGISMPAGARILCVQTVRGNPYLWAEVESEKPLEIVTIHVYGTGNPFPELLPKECRTYIGTVQQYDGRLVWHVYQIGDAK